VWFICFEFVCYPDFARTVFIPQDAKIISGDKIEGKLVAHNTVTGEKDFAACLKATRLGEYAPLAGRAVRARRKN
jgi:hypothetical protein